MSGDLCPSQQYFAEDPIGSDLYPKCFNFSSGIASQGLNVLLINYINSMRLTLSNYEQLLNSTRNNYTSVLNTMENSPDIFSLCKQAITIFINFFW